jgi:3-mercaptopyruvate sulfurtransferase SseA
MKIIAPRKSSLRVFTPIILVTTLFLFIACGGGGYSDPDTGLEVVISPQTLNRWLTDGYGTDAAGYNKMVVLDVNTENDFIAKGHVPGAYLLDTGKYLSSTRSDGVASTISQVATRTQMEELIQRTGIDGNTVVVITGSNMMTIGRAYFNFRYWGFPRNRLRVLSGTTASYAAAGYELSATHPAGIAPSTYSVCELEQNTHLRASFAEMMQIAADDDDTTIVIDSRSADEYNGVAGKTAGTPANPGTMVAFEGHIRTAAHLEFSEFLENNALKSKDEIIDILAARNVSSADTTYSYCRTSWRAAVHFLATDALLGWPAKIYDGAWIEWGQMAGQANAGALSDASPWRTDLAAYSEAITYNNPEAVEGLVANSFAPAGDLINREDAAACGTARTRGGIAPGY